MTGRPNVVVAMLDSVRADVLGCYQGGDATPRIDGIADDGLLFERAFAPAPWTVPTHGSLFTGAYPSEHGTDVGNRYLNPQYTTLAERLQDAGYTTVLYSNNVHLTEQFGFTRGFDIVQSSHAVTYSDDSIDWNEFLKEREHNYGVRKYIETLRHVVENRDKNLIKSARQAANMKYNYHFGDNGAKETNEFFASEEFEEPYFIFINYMEAHNPFRPPAGYGDADPPDVSGWRYEVGLDDLTDTELDTLRELYRSEVRYLDERVGELHDELAGENTVFAVTADHGVSIGEHDLLYHGTGLYNPIVKVPLIFDGTDQVGRVSHSVGLISLFRTICRLAGVDVSEETVRGINLLSVTSDQEVFVEMLGRARDILEAIESELGPEAAATADKYQRALVRGRHKYIREWNPETESWATEGSELYDYVETPDESTELDDEDVRATMRAALDNVADSLEPRENTGGVSDLDSDVENRLQELGYIT